MGVRSMRSVCAVANLDPSLYEGAITIQTAAATSTGDVR
jgi:hypothetical protein